MNTLGAGIAYSPLQGRVTQSLEDSKQRNHARGANPGRGATSAPVVKALAGLSCSCLLLVPALAAAEASSPGSETQEEIVVVGHRAAKAWIEVPASVGIVDAYAIQRGQQQLELGESLAGIPGVFIQNRSNFAQDSRISIRGFGARANFGIRGIRLIVDGIPLTMPDGQGQVDSLDFASAGRIEILRGPSSSLYGSSSGGIIEVTSEEPGAIPVVAARVGFGSHGYRSYQGKAAGRAGNADYLVSFSRQELAGYRDHARMENVLLNTKFRFRFDDSSDLSVVLNHLYAPVADDPGGLSAIAVAADRRAAHPNNLKFDAGESIDNTALGLVLRKAFGSKHETTLSNYYTWRNFDGKIPTFNRGIIELDRFFVGGNLKHVYRDEILGSNLRLTLGVDAEAQLDDRARYNNDDGHRVGMKVSDRREDVTRFGFFLQQEISLPRDFELTGSARFDRVRFEIDDLLFVEASEAFDYREWSFTGALQWNPLVAANPFVRISTSFDTPTTTSLAKPASQGGGINSDLEAQTSVAYELGIKGLVSAGLRYEAAVFHIRVEDELVPYIEDFQTHYENAARSSRTGLELAAFYEFGALASAAEGWVASIAYTFSDFEFDDFESQSGDRFDGKKIPGVPRHLLHAALSYTHASGFFGEWRLQVVDERYANNANTAKAGAYVLSDLRFGYSHRVGDFEFSPFVGINNLFAEEYIDNLRINHTGNPGRFFEPAPKRNAYGGLQISYHIGSP